MILPDIPADLPHQPDESDESGNGSDPRHPAPAPSPAAEDAATGETPPLPPELGGQKGPEPTRYGDWEKGGRCTDF